MLSENGLLAGTILELYPPSIRKALASNRSVHAAIHEVVEGTISLGDYNVRFSQADFIEAQREALANRKQDVQITCREGTNWRVRCCDQGILTFRNDEQSFEFPECRYIAADKETRIVGLEIFAKDLLPKSDFDHWHSKLKSRMLHTSEVSQLQADVLEIPSFVANQIETCIRAGRARWDELVPTGKRYAARLIGSADKCGTLDEYIREGLEQWHCDLPEQEQTSLIYQALLNCGTTAITQKLSAILPIQLDVQRLVEWSRSSRNPTVRVALIELLIIRLKEDNEYEKIIGELLQDLISADPTSGHSDYEVFSDCLQCVLGQIFLSNGLADCTPFYSRLFGFAQANLLFNVISSVSEEHKRELSAPLRERREHLFLIGTLANIRNWRRWRADFVLPRALFADHLGRVANISQLHKELIPQGSLHERLFGDDSDSLPSQLNFPFSHVPSLLEGETESAFVFPPDEVSELIQKLEERPVPLKAFTPVINLGYVTKLGASLIDASIEALQSVGRFLPDTEERSHLYGTLEGLAHVAAIERSSGLAAEVSKFCRRHWGGLDNSLGAVAALRLNVVASAAYEDATEGASHLANDLSPDWSRI